MTKLSTIVWLAVAAIAVPLWAIAQQYRYVTVVAGAEDDCAIYYGVYKLYDVVGFDVDGRHHVECRYG